MPAGLKSKRLQPNSLQSIHLSNYDSYPESRIPDLMLIGTPMISEGYVLEKRQLGVLGRKYGR